MVETRRQFVLGVDLDGVVVDFYAGLRPIAAEWLGVQEESLPRDVSYGLPEWDLGRVGTYEDLHRFAVTHRDLFKVLKPISGAPVGLRKLSRQGIRIRILTHRLFVKYFHQEAVGQTTTWLEHHGVPYWDLCFMRDKAAVGADLYVEDTPSNVEKLRADNHPTIVFTNSTNRDVEGPRANTWSEVVDMVLQHHEEWKDEQSDRELPGL